MQRGYAWLDSRKQEGLLEAGQFIATLERLKALKIACLEAIALRNGFITSEQLQKLAQPLAKNGYCAIPATFARRGRLAMKVTPTAVPEVLIIELKRHGDAYGFFYKNFN